MANINLTAFKSNGRSGVSVLVAPSDQARNPVLPFPTASKSKIAASPSNACSACSNARSKSRLLAPKRANEVTSGKSAPEAALQFNRPTRSRRLIDRHHDLQVAQALFAGCERFFVLHHALRHMVHLRSKMVADSNRRLLNLVAAVHSHAQTAIGQPGIQLKPTFGRQRMKLRPVC